MSTKRVNPIEEMELRLARIYVEMVKAATEFYAPHRPNWHADLSPEAQLYRYMDMREDVIGWLLDISEYYPEVKTTADLHKSIELYALDPNFIAKVPPALIVDPRGDKAKQLVQAVGPHEAAKHIAKMERMALRRELAAGLLAPEPADMVPQWTGLPPMPPDALTAGTGAIPVPAAGGGAMPPFA